MNIENNYLVTGLIVVSFTSVMTLILTNNPTTNKASFIASLPGVKKSYVNTILEYEPLRNFLENMTKATGIKNDGPSMLIKEEVRSVLLSLLIALFMIYVGQSGVGLAIVAFMALYPFIRRMMDKKEYRKQYISGFYTFLNYITQYLTGGVEMRQALIEVEKLIPKDNVIKPKLEDVISRNAITGFAGNSYISALEELNKGLDYSEIDAFISSARRAQKNGEPIGDTLLDQIDDIHKRVEITKRGHIATYESKFGIFIVIFGMLSTLVMFCVPIFVSAILSLGAV